MPLHQKIQESTLQHSHDWRSSNCFSPQKSWDRSLLYEDAAMLHAFHLSLVSNQLKEPQPTQLHWASGKKVSLREVVCQKVLLPQVSYRHPLLPIWKMQSCMQLQSLKAPASQNWQMNYLKRGYS
uniref:Uncharacterized protein n=1 Tax=Opuntia streptacantha TaxID=393608 RepID=A0A7C9ABA5_OPUST